MSGARILVVEDNPDLSAALFEVLTGEGYQVEQAQNGAQAVARLRAPDPPDVVLLDLMMPVMDGWEFLAQRKHDPLALPARVLVMSGDDSAKARAADADAFLQKPFVTSDLLATVAQLLDEQKQRQARLRDLRLEQLASLGRLAAGVAHEINNPLTYVAGNLALLEEELAKLPEVSGDLRALLRGAAEGADRIGRIVSGLQLLVRRDEATGPVEIAPVLESALNLAGNELRHRATLVRELEVGVTAYGSASRLTQLFLNLLLTAAQQLPEGAAAEHPLRVSARANGPRVVVEVLGSDSPLTSEGQRQLADGLGMTICRQLVAELGAQLQIQQSGGVSLLRVILPTCAPAPIAAAARASSATGRGRILIVDDEPRIGALLARSLGREHDVTALTSAREALTRLEAGERWDLILCDMMMPEMTGMELHAEVTARFPEVAERMVFLTGGAFTPRAQAFLEHLTQPHLDKPIDMARLKALVRERVGSG